MAERRTLRHRWFCDTITSSFVLTISLAFIATMVMNGLFSAFAGVWGRPSLLDSGLLSGAATAVKVIEAQPPATRPALAIAASTKAYQVTWYPGTQPLDQLERLKRNYDEGLERLRELLQDPGRTAIFFASDSKEMAGARFGFDPARDGEAYFMGVALQDGTWLIFTVRERSWGLAQWERGLLEAVFAALSVMLFATLTARRLARPVKQLAEGVRRFGADPQAPPIPENGPRELRETIAAFNAMQAQIRRFVQDRTAMLAAISHDLRTPLTRMRLRGEFIEDPVQQKKLFRDVDEMQGMVDAALAFFRDDAGQEPATSFDLPELLKSIVDDCGDQGVTVDYVGPDHAVQRGRPLALRRVFANLVENAIKYATPPQIALRMTPQGAEIRLRDHGRGIPEDCLEQVFAPFQRLEQSRNRSTGGVGLGLTSARSIVRAHGGEITLSNHPGGGLEVLVFLPASTG